MDLATVLYRVDDHVARIVMNRPERRNALDFQLLDDLDVAFASAESDPDVHAVVLATPDQDRAELTEQAAASLGAASEERTSARIAQQEEELDALEKERESRTRK